MYCIEWQNKTNLSKSFRHGDERFYDIDKRTFKDGPYDWTGEKPRKEEYEPKNPYITTEMSNSIDSLKILKDVKVIKQFLYFEFVTIKISLFFPSEFLHMSGFDFN